MFRQAQQFFVAALLVIAAAMKLPHALHDWGFLSAFQIVAEVVLASLLILGIWARTVRWVCISVFACFLVYAIALAFTGAESCGCFGDLRISPWITAGLDATVIIAVLVAAPEAQPPTLKWRSLSLVGQATILMLLASAALHYNRGVAAQPPSGSSDHPSSWVGKPFPLKEHIALAGDLNAGDWLVLLHRPDCSKCQQACRSLEYIAGGVDLIWH